MSGRDRPLADVPARVSVADDRLTVAADVGATCRVSTPRHRPLGGTETHATVTVAGDGARVELELDGVGLQTFAAEVLEACAAMGVDVDRLDAGADDGEAER